MQITFFERFMKQADSTKIPPADYNSFLKPIYEGEIKGDFSPLAPVVRFKTIPATKQPTCTYCYIESFRRYYFMSWAFVSGFWEASLTCDVLGSFRAEILNSTQYVKRSASESDGLISDAANYPSAVAHGASITYAQQQNIWGVDFEQGTIVISVVNNSEGGNIGACTYYAMTYLAFRALMLALLRSPDWMEIDTSEISSELQKALINPMQYVTSCIWLPIASRSFVLSGEASDRVTSIKFGWWTFNLQTTIRILHDPFGQYDSWSRTIVFNFTDHPQADRGEWLNLAPYTRRTLDIPPFGTIDLDTTDLTGFSALSMRIFIQAYTGDALLYVYAGNYTTDPNNAKIIMSLTGSVGIPLPVGQIRMDASKFKSALIGGAVVAAADWLGGE